MTTIIIDPRASSTTTNSININGLTEYEKKKKLNYCAMMCNFLWMTLPMIVLQSDSNRVVYIVTCQKHR
jgi:hypothetical protein